MQLANISNDSTWEYCFSTTGIFFGDGFTWSRYWPVYIHVAIACKYYMWMRSDAIGTQCALPGRESLKMAVQYFHKWLVRVCEHSMDERTCPLSLSFRCDVAANHEGNLCSLCSFWRRATLRYASVCRNLFYVDFSFKKELIQPKFEVFEQCIP